MKMNEMIFHLTSHFLQLIAIKNENLDIVKLLLKQDAIDSNYSIIWHCFEPEMDQTFFGEKEGNELCIFFVNILKQNQISFLKTKLGN